MRSRIAARGASAPCGGQGPLVPAFLSQGGKQKGRSPTPGPRPFLKTPTLLPTKRHCGLHGSLRPCGGTHAAWRHDSSGVTSVANDGATVLGEYDVDAVVAARPTVGEDRATEAAGAAVCHARCFLSTAARNLNADLLRTAGAGVHHAQRHIDGLGRARGAAWVRAAGIAAVATVVAKASFCSRGSVEHGHRQQTGAEQAGCKKRGTVHDVLSPRQEGSRRDGRQRKYTRPQAVCPLGLPRNRYSLPDKNTLTRFRISTSVGIDQREHGVPRPIFVSGVPSEPSRPVGYAAGRS